MRGGFALWQGAKTTWEKDSIPSFVCTPVPKVLSLILSFLLYSHEQGLFYVNLRWTLTLSDSFILLRSCTVSTQKDINVQEGVQAVERMTPPSPFLFASLRGTAQHTNDEAICHSLACHKDDDRYICTVYIQYSPTSAGAQQLKYVKIPLKW